MTEPVKQAEGKELSSGSAKANDIYFIHIGAAGPFVRIHFVFDKKRIDLTRRDLERMIDSIDESREE